MKIKLSIRLKIFAAKKTLKHKIRYHFGVDMVIMYNNDTHWRLSINHIPAL